MKYPYSKTAEILSLWQWRGWRFFRIERTKFFFGVLNGRLQFNQFYGVKIWKFKFWIGRHYQRPRDLPKNSVDSVRVKCDAGS